MLIERGQLIGGWPAVEVRDVMRELRDCSMSAKVLAERFAEADPAAAVGRLQDVGLIERDDERARCQVADGEDWRETVCFRTTIAGNALAKARIGKPMVRAKADALFSGLLDRARAENEDPDGLLWVDAVIVFGSYVIEARQSVGDIDAQVLYDFRYDTDEHRRRNGLLLAQREAEGRSTPSSFIARLGFAELELQKRLRARQSRLDLQFDRTTNPRDLPEGATTREMYRR